MKDQAPKFDGYDDITPPCDGCAEPHVGVGTEVVMVIRGMLFPNMQYDCPMFVPDPDIKITIVQLPNDALGFVTDETHTKFLHHQCQADLIEEVSPGLLRDDEIDDDDDDDDEDNEDEEYACLEGDTE